MSLHLFDGLIGILWLSLLSVLALLLPLILELGLLFLVGRVFWALACKVSWRLVSLLGLIGVPVHEFSHAIAFLLTLSGVEAVTPLIDPKTQVAPTYSRRAHPVGMFVSGLAPLFGGTLVLWLAARYIIPGLDVPAVPPLKVNLENIASWNSLLRGSVAYVGQLLATTFRYLPDLQWHNWRTYFGLYVALSVAFGLAPSTQDLRLFCIALPAILLLSVGVFGVWYAIGDGRTGFLAVQAGLAPHLFKFSTAVTYAFILTLFGVVLLMPVALIKQVRRS